ncbi:MAG: histidinol-phosphatase HisJ family protein [Clostridia bacterium]|nr:histidinol-phosphatase HisJ family protein [Clostridia bacterium]
MPLYDTHTHTNHSHDSECALDDLCEAAFARGMTGVTVTDHADIEYYRTTDVRARVNASFRDADAHRAAWAGRLKVLRGVEIGEGVWDPDAARELLSDAPFDQIIGSVHAVRMEGYTKPYSGIDFSRMPAGDLARYLHGYFEDMLDMVTTADVDVLAHVTCPLRYITGKFGISVDMSAYDRQIDRVLRAAADRGLALEVNTSCTGTAYDELMPYGSIIRRFMDFGGTRFTIGSDCHAAVRCGAGFDRAVDALRRLGVTQAVYYENRQPVPYTPD